MNNENVVYIIGYIYNIYNIYIIYIYKMVVILNYIVIHVQYF